MPNVKVWFLADRLRNAGKPIKRQDAKTPRNLKESLVNLVLL
jgi:hypothetical protein